MFDSTVFILHESSQIRDEIREFCTRHGLKSESYESAESFLAEYDSRIPGCIILEQALPGLSGLELEQVLAAYEIILPTIFYVENVDVMFAVQAMKHGAVNVFQKPCRETPLLAAIEEAFVRCQEDRAKQMQRQQAAARIRSLRDEERQVLKLLLVGMLNKQMAVRLNVSLRTIENRRARVLEVLGVQTLPDLIRLCIHAGFIEA